MSVAVRMEGVSKFFGRVRACDAVDLAVAAGNTHAIVGENGAGKTTLMRVLYGMYRPDAGSIEVAGQAVQFHSPRDAIAAGVGMVSQHYSIIAQLSCINNLVLGAEMAAGGFLRHRDAVARANELAKRMGFEFDWDAPAERLSPAGCQKLEILKLLWRDASILVLDEPTAMLSPPDAAALFQNLRELAAAGKTILLVTHRLREVVDYCDFVTVMRNGKKVGECDTADTDIARLANWIVGEDLRPRDAVGAPRAGEPVLTALRLIVKGDRGDTAVNGLDLEVRAGELVGVAGVDGNGQTELYEALAGLRRLESGSVAMSGSGITRIPTGERLKRGMRLIPADRHRFGIVEEWPVLDNAILSLQRCPPISKRGLLNAAASRQTAQHEVQAFSVKTDSLYSPVVELSGGNQQRLVVARALEQRPTVLMALQPCRGLDVRGAVAVFEALSLACAEGTGALVFSFDLDELLEHCNPILVMREGRIVARLHGDEIDRERIGRLMVGLEDGLP